MSKLSFILPTLNEASVVKNQLARLQLYREAGHEVILVDGGSCDTTVQLAAGFVDQLLVTAPGRSLQMNAGAARATGDLLVFLHVDTELPQDAAALITQAMAVPESGWGWFCVRLSNSRLPFKIIASCMNLRAQLTFVCTGDQTMFVKRDLFNRVGGFPQLPLMEDVAVSKLLRRKSTPNWITQPVIASSRRWERQGILHTVLLMWWLRLLYFLGVNPARLLSMYYPAMPKS